MVHNIPESDYKKYFKGWMLKTKREKESKLEDFKIRMSSSSPVSGFDLDFTDEEQRKAILNFEDQFILADRSILTYSNIRDNKTVMYIETFNVSIPITKKDVGELSAKLHYMYKTYGKKKGDLVWLVTAIFVFVYDNDSAVNVDKLIGTSEDTFVNNFLRLFEETVRLGNNLNHAATETGFAKGFLPPPPPPITSPLSTILSTPTPSSAPSLKSRFYTKLNMAKLISWVNLKDEIKDHWSGKVFSDTNIEIKDSGFRALLWAVLIVDPGLLHSVILSNEYNGQSTEIDARFLNSKLETMYNVMNGTITMPDEEFVNLLSGLFALRCNQVLDVYKDSMFSSATFTDTRLHYLDMALNLFGVGIKIGKEVVGDVENVNSAEIIIKSSTIYVKRPKFIKPKSGVYNELYERDKIHASRFLNWLDDDGHWGKGDPYHSVKFWIRCNKQYISTSKWGNKYLLSRAMKHV